MTGKGQRRTSFIILCISLFLVMILFGVRAKYGQNLYWTLAAIQFIVICLAAWMVGAREVRDESEPRRKLAVAGVLLIAPIALLSLLPGIAPPDDQTHAENQRRFLILLISSLLTGGGFTVLKEVLSESGERFFSTLGLAAILPATPLYAIFAAVQYGGYVAVERGWSWAVSVSGSLRELTPLDGLSITLLFFGGILTYFATAAFAAALGRAQWLRTGAVRTFVAVSGFALLCLLLRGMDYPSLTKAADHWYAFLGFVAGIPAVPWLMPCLLGVLLLRRAGDQPDEISRVANSPYTR